MTSSLFRDIPLVSLIFTMLCTEMYNGPSSLTRSTRFKYPNTMEAHTEYTVIVRGQVFVLTLDQLYRDAPNYFTAFIERSFKQSSEGVRELKLYRDPYLFSFIHAYLSGYDVLPLPVTNIPGHLSEESQLKNLLVDARFYGLDSLATELEGTIRPTRAIRPNKKASGLPTWKILYVTTFYSQLA